MTGILSTRLALGARSPLPSIVALIVPAARLTITVFAVILLLLLPILLWTTILLTAVPTRLPLAALAAVATRFGVALVVATLVVAVPIVAVAAIPVVAAIAAVAAAVLLLAGTDRLTLVAIIIVIAVDVEIGLLAARLLILEAATLVAEHAEIMVGELQIIFSVHAIALPLRIRGKVLVLFVQLVGVAARAVIDAVAVVGTTLATGTLATTAIATTAGIATTAATATGLPIIDQAVRP